MGDSGLIVCLGHGQMTTTLPLDGFLNLQLHTHTKYEVTAKYTMLNLCIITLKATFIQER